jgi:hypothetical protein
MSARNTLLHFAGKAGLVLGAIFVMTVLLAATPGHRTPADQEPAPQESAAPQYQPMPGMDMSEEKANERDAVQDMTPGHHESHNSHMTMTAMRPETPEDVARAKEIVAELRSGIEKYKDYHVALQDGFRIFMPNLPQQEYHFTNYYNGFLESFTFDPARPTSLLYKKTGTGYELIGAMYTMPKRVSEEQLNERVPLSIAQWHLHTKLCLPPKEQRGHADMTKFGLQGSILTKEACTEAGGTFYPVIFGWMVHVYPFENTREKIWGQ